MGVDYSSRCGIGLKIPLQHFRKKVLVKLGKHDFDKSTRFHPKTGEKLWEEREQLPEDLADLTDEEEAEFDGLDVEIFDDGVMGERPDNLFICVMTLDVYGEGRDNVEGQIFSEEDDQLIGTSRKVLQKIFEPRGYWDPENFGLWLVITAS